MARCMDVESIPSHRGDRRPLSGSNDLHPVHSTVTRRTDAGAWQAYYRKWQDMTLDRLDRDLIDLVSELRRFVPPARIFDKMTYSPWMSGQLHRVLQTEAVETLVITGGETDVCVLAAVLGGIDLGYRIRVLTDAICSGADDTHDATLKLLGDRFSVQLDLLETETFLKKAASAR